MPGTSEYWYRGVVFVMVTACVPIVGGCFPDPPVSFDSPAPTKRLDAIARASEDTGTDTLEKLVGKLGSTDPAERMLAIRALERREGTTLGYDHAAPAWERLEAIERWRTRLGLETEGRSQDGEVEGATGFSDPEAERDGSPTLTADAGSVGSGG